MNKREKTILWALKLVAIFYGVVAIIGVTLFIIGVTHPNAIPNTSLVYCEKDNGGMGTIGIKTGQIMYQRDGVYIISGSYIQQDISEDGNSMIVVASGFTDHEPYYIKDCMRKQGVGKYEDIVKQFRESGGFYLSNI